MKNLLKANWFLFILFAALISVKIYYINLSFQNGLYSDEIAYNFVDASHYLKIAENISEFNVYSDNNSNIATEKATWRSPFWPWVLSLFFNLTNNLFILIILKFILELSLMVFALLKIKNNPSIKKIYFLPFLLIFLEPQYLKYSITFLSESFTAVLMMVFLAFFLSLNIIKKYHIAIPILASLIILAHPVSIFFILSIFIIYLLYNVKSNFKISILHGLLFSIIILVWPIRNQMTFNKGFYLTASQGTTFSIGWNEKVSTQFTNVNGDLADPGLNLKYADIFYIKNINNSTLNLSKAYTNGTINFLKNISFKEKIKIIYIKIKSNFNPFPENPKPGFLEELSILFRIIYLLVFVQLIFRLFNKEKFNFNSIKDKTFFIVASVLIGQILMSIYIYTGLRFNSIYSLTMLTCFILLNLKTINSLIDFIWKKLIIS
ncbi:hypothetical protein [Bizionia myxarmorum]|uniref:Glycosyltransferase RgtA/B/C/D-like domain-containing protein n=1 Tax=Bizionia myxarmorum TaxID=291186 RepID=A0A5D0R7Z4_9FLAO|nr:hypothetical protein [Bizionia myxarmorum]TYB77001.1 hypothetical protein ES674_09875 [Bizionia myxarmorum]